jgi:hypothetical protein
MIKLKKYLNLLFISLIALTGCSGRGSDEAVKLIGVSLSSNSVEKKLGSKGKIYNLVMVTLLPVIGF